MTKHFDPINFATSKMNALAHTYYHLPTETFDTENFDTETFDIETGIYESYAWVDIELERRAALEEITYNQQVPGFDFTGLLDDDDYEPFTLITNDSLTISETDSENDYDFIAITVDNYMLDATIYRKYRIRNDDVSNYF